MYYLHNLPHCYTTGTSATGTKRHLPDSGQLCFCIRASQRAGQITSKSLGQDTIAAWLLTCNHGVKFQASAPDHMHNHDGVLNTLHT